MFMAKSEDSWFSKGVCEAWNCVANRLYWLIGDGNKVRLWEDE